MNIKKFTAKSLTLCASLLLAGNISSSVASDSIDEVNRIPPSVAFMKQQALAKQEVLLTKIHSWGESADPASCLLDFQEQLKELVNIHTKLGPMLNEIQMEAFVDEINSIKPWNGFEGTFDFDKLDRNIKAMIVSWMDPKTLLSFSLTCRQAYEQFEKAAIPSQIFAVRAVDEKFNSLIHQLITVGKTLSTRGMFTYNMSNGAAPNSSSLILNTSYNMATFELFLEKEVLNMKERKKAYLMAIELYPQIRIALNLIKESGSRESSYWNSYFNCLGTSNT
ncbi:MAG: F-box protein [Alphaproteobacteria bacterium]|nr:F-box protein [Alphaproteobacteria bacterium]